jgi:hypothetical protein
MMIVSWFMSGIRRLFGAPDWAAFSPLLKKVSEFTKNWGTEDGAMRIQLQGGSLFGSAFSHPFFFPLVKQKETGKIEEISWNLLGTHNHGPYVPCTPSVILALKLLR